ncbi:hypothetical protein KAI78_09780 [bacterium]|nr:hypothetical protein [bacterium]
MKRFLEPILLIIVLLFLVNLLLNFTLKKIAVPGRDGYGFISPDAELGFYHNPSLSFRTQDKGRVWSDERGFRPCGTGNASADTVYVLGDSMIDLLVDNCKLPAAFMGGDSKDKRYISSGCMSFSTMQEYILLKRIHQKYHGKEFHIYVYTGNDLFQNTQGISTLPVIRETDDGFELISPEKTRGIPITKRFILFSIIESYFFGKNEDDPSYWHDLMYGYTLDSMEENLDEMLNKTAFVLNLINEYSTANDISVRYYIIPTSMEITSPNDEGAVKMARLRHAFIDILASHSASFTDLTPVINKVYEPGFYDPVNFHLTSDAWKKILGTH